LGGRGKSPRLPPSLRMKVTRFRSRKAGEGGACILEGRLYHATLGRLTAKGENTRYSEVSRKIKKREFWRAGAWVFWLKGGWRGVYGRGVQGVLVRLSRRARGDLNLSRKKKLVPEGFSKTGGQIAHIRRPRGGGGDFREEFSGKRRRKNRSIPRPCGVVKAIRR